METIERLRKVFKVLLSREKSYVVGCSGGADSMALVDALHRAGYRQLVCHVNHGLRGLESDGDAEYVASFCQERNIPYCIAKVDVQELVEREKLSIEAAARKLRYEAFNQALKEFHGDNILTAHQKNDQAETFLFRLLRGSGTKGLVGIKVKRDNLIRPLLKFTAEELREYCRSRAIQWREDSSNTDISFTRNRIRHVLMPLLEKEFNPNVVETLARTSNILNQDYECLLRLAEVSAKGCITKETDTTLECNLLDWYNFDEALQKRCLLYFWSRLTTNNELGAVHVEALLHLCLRYESGKCIMLPGGWLATFKKGVLYFEPNTLKQGKSAEQSPTR